ncbi:MAG: transcription elongation factor GreAB [Deltaproteobacteria bacterium]|nr:transcription elongation factor GreAB [Deltaproteobacteria bacterium]
MSKAFTKEDEAEAPRPVPRRASLPTGQVNYVTAAGLQALRDEHDELMAARAAAAADAATVTRIQAQLVELEMRIASATVVTPTSASHVRFGTFVVVQNQHGVRSSYQVVGVDGCGSGAAVVFVAARTRVDRARGGRRCDFHDASW